MDILSVILLIVAAVLFAVAAFGVSTRLNLIALGLFFFVLAFLAPELERLS